jgi:hypothetical protein
MIIFSRKQLTHAIINPLVSLRSTTVGAMPIAATVVLLVHVIARIVIAFE